MKKLLSENRLKLGSFFAVLGDIFLGLAGGVSLFSPDTSTTAGIMLMMGGILGVLGHGAVFLWGKGAKSDKAVRAPNHLHTPLLLKPVFPWRYPLDFGFAVWIVGGALYFFAGVYSDNPGLIALGSFTMPAACIGWLWPQKRTLFGLHTMQVIAILYACSSVSGFIGAFIAKDVILLIAMLCFSACNVIFFTVRKENQSLHTQSHEA